MCAILGVVNVKDAASLVALGLHALQHRGQEGYGIALKHEGGVYVHKQMGLVGQMPRGFFESKPQGWLAIGHTRYSTMGRSSTENLQPLVTQTRLGELALVHNGNLVNAVELRKRLEGRGAIFQTTNDTEIILHLMVHSQAETQVEALYEALTQVEGAYSLLLLYGHTLLAVRDPRGFRPLVMGRLEGGGIVFASESCALDFLRATEVRELRPGEWVEVQWLEGKVSVKSFFPLASREERRCLFELIYFARPDSRIFGESVYKVRRRLGEELAYECPCEGGEVVIPVPDSGVVSALGYAKVSGIKFEMGFLRSHYVGRTFIQPGQSSRVERVGMKLFPVKEVVEGRCVVVVDDSLVRGTTSRALVRLLREAGAREVHFRIASSLIRYPCFYGIDTPTRSELIASHFSKEGICDFIQADSLEYLSLEGMKRAVSQASSYCLACFTGHYPTLVPLSS